jgi:hypothetical protein
VGHPRYSKEEIAQRGQAIYDEQLWQKVEAQKENIGKFLVVDIETGDYEVDEQEIPAFHRMRERHPDGAFFLIRIGYPTAYKMGGGRWGPIQR